MKRYVAAAAAVTALALAPAAWAHAEISPAVVEAKAAQVFTLAVPTEKEGVATTRVELTPPAGFAIDSVATVPGWRSTAARAGSGEEAEITRVIWFGGHVPTGEAALFPLVASTDAAGTYEFAVRQTYSDGSVVEWSGPEDSDTPAPTIEAKSSLGGGGTSVATWIALALAALAVVLGAVALAVRAGGRELA